jgi:hypothetical protein
MIKGRHPDILGKEIWYLDYKVIYWYAGTTRGFLQWIELGTQAADKDHR